MSEKLNTIIVTCDRGETNYLDETVYHLEQQKIQPLFIQHGSDFKGNIRTIWPRSIHQKEFIISILPGSNATEFMKSDIRHRHNTNYAAAFLLGDIQKDALILEDDVVCCKNLQEQLKALYWLIAHRKVTHYIIALYSCVKWPLSAQNLNEYQVEKFFGLQAMLYSANLRQVFHDAHLKYCDQEPADFITRIVAKEQNLPILATTFSLFQHIGKQTTGLGAFHQTGNFLDGKN